MSDTRHLKTESTELTELNKELYKDYLKEQNAEKAGASKKKKLPTEFQQLIDMIPGSQYEQCIKGPKGDLFVIGVPDFDSAKKQLNKFKKWRGKAAVREGFLAQQGLARHGRKLILGHGLPNYSWNADTVNVKDLK